MGGLILILIGCFLLLVNFGWVDWSFFRYLWQFWPVLLILAGIKLMVSSWAFGRFLVGLLSALILVYLFCFALYQTSSQARPYLEPFAPYFPREYQPLKLDPYELEGIDEPIDWLSPVQSQ